MKIKIWSEDNSNEEYADELEVDAELESEWFWDYVEYGVEEYAEKDHHESDYWDQSTFCVRVGEELRRYSVEVQMEPTFCVAQIKDKETKTA
jgi:hypothetical protein